MKCQRCGSEVPDKEVRLLQNAPYSRVCEECYHEMKNALEGIANSRASNLEDRSLYFPAQDGREIMPIAERQLRITPGNKIKAKIVDVPLRRILLDPKNERFRHITKNLKDPQLEEMLWKQESTKMLYKQIRWSGGLQEKPILKKKGKYFITKEGNKRIVCLRKLKQQLELSEMDSQIDIDPVRCLVLPEDTPKADESVILSRLHVKGKSEWGAFQKSAHIYELIKNGMEYEDVSNAVGISQAKLRRMNKTFQNMMEYKHNYNHDNWKDKYSYFYELEKRRYSENKKNPLPEGWISDNLDKFMEFVYKGQIEKGKDVRELPKIVSNEEAYNVLLEGGTIRAALEVLSQYDPTAGSKTFSKLSTIQRVIAEISEEKMKEISSNPTRVNFLKELRQNLDTMIQKIENQGKILD